VYFAMITLGFSQVIYVFMRDWDYVGSNPSDGISVSFDTHPQAFEIGVPFVDGLSHGIGKLAAQSLTVAGVELSTVEVSYYLVGLVALVCYFAMQRIVHSPFGKVMLAIRENEERARAVGYDTYRYKLVAFAVSAFFAAVAGGLFAGYSRAVSPDETFFFLVTGDALLVSIIGGFGTLAGPLFGTWFDELVREFLSKAGTGGGLLPFLQSYLPQGVLDAGVYGGMTVGRAVDTFLNGHASLYLGVLFVLFVLFVPNGLLGTVRDRLGGRVSKRVADRLRSAGTSGGTSGSDAGSD
jgi:branched-chain amino acid transport system permease protein